MLHIFHTETTPARQSQDAHALAQRAYTFLSRTAAPPICKTAAGKPYFPDHRYTLSITHTPGAALCALADLPVGLDAEAPRPVQPRLMERCLAPTELVFCRQMADPAVAFLRFWTLKEAYGKYTGQGVIGFPHDWCFTLHGQQAELAGSACWFQTLTVCNLCVSVCCEKPQMFQMHLNF